MKGTIEFPERYAFTGKYPHIIYDETCPTDYVLCLSKFPDVNITSITWENNHFVITWETEEEEDAELLRQR